MGGMWNGGDGIGRRGMDIFGIGRTIGSGGPQGFGGVSVLVVFFVALWVRWALQFGVRCDRGDTTGGGAEKWVLDLMCVSNHFL